MFRLLLSMLLIALCFTSGASFARLPVQMKKNNIRGTPTNSNMKLNVFLAPQILFIASAAVAVIAYAVTNLDSIIAGQKAVIEKVQTEQKTGLQSVQEKQAADLKRIQNEQAANIAKARQSAQDAQKRK